MFSKVAEFHLASDQRIAAFPEFPDAETRALRRRLLDEEYREFLAAEAADDLCEIADALADMAYIACGTALAYGTAAAEVYHPRFTTGSLLTPGLPGAAVRQHVRRMLRRVMAEYEHAEDANAVEAVGGAIVAMLDAIDIVALAFDIPLRRVFDEVHRSNMTKFGADGRPLRRDDGKIIKGPNWSPPDIAGVLGLHADDGADPLPVA